MSNILMSFQVTLRNFCLNFFIDSSQILRFKVHCSVLMLRYYTNFKVRKFESFFYKINMKKTTKNYHLHWVAGRGNILSNYIIYIFFNFGRGFCGSVPMLFPKAPASCCKEILNLFLLYCTSIFMNSKSVSQIFKILFQTRDINIFVFRGIFFSRYVQLKSSFSDEKYINGEI